MLQFQLGCCVSTNGSRDDKDDDNNDNNHDNNLVISNPGPQPMKQTLGSSYSGAVAPFTTNGVILCDYYGDYDCGDNYLLRLTTPSYPSTNTSNARLRSYVPASAIC